MSTETYCHFALKSDFYICFFFHDLIHDLIHVYSPGAGQTALRGQNFDVNIKALSLCPFVASFQNNLFEV